MLQDAAEREKLLQERLRREKEELKRENKRLKKQNQKNKKLALAAAVSIKPREYIPVVKVPVTPSPVATKKKLIKEETSVLTYKQLNEMVHIDHSTLGSLSDLPLDILLHTFSYLPSEQVLKLSLVSVDMNKVAENGLLWRELFSRQHPKSKLTANNIADWKFTFMREVYHIMDELVCFHTKLNYDEDVLGIPINFTVNPVTQRVDYVSI